MTQQINLYRPIFRKQEKKFSSIAMAQAGAGLLVGIAAIYAVFSWQVGEARSELRQAEKRHVDVSAQLQSVTEKFGQKGEGLSEAETLEREIVARRQIMQAMSQNALGNSRGYAEYFKALERQHVDGVWITGIAITGAGDDIKFQGRTIDAVRVARFVQRLSNEKALAGKQFELLTITNDGKESSLEFVLQTKNDAAQGVKP